MIKKMLHKYRIWKKERLIRKYIKQAAKNWKEIEIFLNQAGWSREKKKGLRKSIIEGDFKFFGMN